VRCSGTDSREKSYVPVSPVRSNRAGQNLVTKAVISNVLYGDVSGAHGHFSLTETTRSRPDNSGMITSERNKFGDTVTEFLGAGG
jgi:hypothetical protein